jgi:uncharacterized membrane protein (UPF0127 family)
MHIIMIRNLSRPTAGQVRARSCDRFLCQLRGLTFRRSLAPDEGLLLVERKDSRLEAAIHMLAVFTDLAVIWVNSQHEVVDVRLARSWRPAYVPKRPARFVLELAPERIGDFQVGDRLLFDGVN